MRVARAGARLAGVACAVLVAGCGAGAAPPGGASSSTDSSAAATGSTTASTAATSTQPTTGTSPSVSASNTSAPAATPTLARGFHLTSSAFPDGGAIPPRHTCRGINVSPPLSIAGVPAAARELVLVMRDPDARGGGFVHWALAGITSGTRALPSGGVVGLVSPGRNSFGTLGYRGPCPPPGALHHYVFTISALAGRSGLRAGFSADALAVPAVGLATLTGTFRG